MTSNSKPGLVLVVEDDRRAADALALLIRDWGYDYIHAADLKSVLSAVGARAHEVRAIVSDYHLRDDTTGVDVVAAAAQHGVSAPVLFLTGTLRGGARRAAAAAGHRFMEKPVAPERLKAWLEAAAVDRES